MNQLVSGRCQLYNHTLLRIVAFRNFVPGYKSSKKTMPKEAKYRKLSSNRALKPRKTENSPFY